MNTAQLADAQRYKHGLPAGDPDLAIFATALVDKQGNIKVEGDQLVIPFGTPASAPAGTRYLLPAGSQQPFFGTCTIAGQITFEGEARFLTSWPT